jgi:hypothetical protein
VKIADVNHPLGPSGLANIGISLIYPVISLGCIVHPPVCSDLTADVFFAIFSICIADFVFLCKKIQKVSSKSDFLFLLIISLDGCQKVRNFMLILDL